KRTARRVAVRTTERNSVKGVKHLPAELEAVTLSNVEVLTHAHVPGIDARLKRRIPSNVAGCSLHRRNSWHRLHKVTRDQVMGKVTRLRVNFMNTGGKIRVVSTVTLPRRRLAAKNSERLSRLRPVNAANLPSAQSSLGRTIPSWQRWRFVDEIRHKYMRSIDERISTVALYTIRIVERTI